MAVCSFDIPFTGSAEDLLARARDSIKAQGGKFEGDVLKGSFSLPLLGSAVAGTYAVNINVAHFEISQKPFLVSCGQIESALKQFAIGQTPAPGGKEPRQKL